VPFAVEYTDDAEGPDLLFTLFLLRPLTRQEREDLDRLLLAWYEVGVHGDFRPFRDESAGGKGVLHNMHDTPVIVDDGVLSVRWGVDLGSAPRAAVDVLIAALDGWGADQTLLASGETPSTEKLLIGYYDSFNADGDPPQGLVRLVTSVIPAYSRIRVWPGVTGQRGGDRVVAVEARQLAALYKSDPESATVRAADALRQKPEAAVSHLDTDDAWSIWFAIRRLSDGNGSADPGGEHGPSAGAGLTGPAPLIRATEDG